MKTFEDNEIIKALECCLSGKDYDTACMKCPIEPICESDDILFKYALDLINRLQDEKQALINGQETLQNTIVEQKAEIERLKHRKTELQIRNQELQHEKSEAIKEFAERLKKKIINTPFGIDCTGETDEYREGCLRGLVAKQHNVIDMVDNLIKEMTEVLKNGKR